MWFSRSSSLTPKEPFALVSVTQLNEYKMFNVGLVLMHNNWVSLPFTSSLCCPLYMSNTVCVCSFSYMQNTYFVAFPTPSPFVCTSCSKDKTSSSFSPSHVLLLQDYESSVTAVLLRKVRRRMSADGSAAVWYESWTNFSGKYLSKIITTH